MSEGPQTLDAGESVRVLADSLWKMEAGERAGAMLRDGPVCPCDVVPLVAVVDFHRRRGVDFTLSAPDGTALAAAISGLTSGRLAPDLENPPDNPFGRVWRFSSYDEQNALVNAMTLQLGKSALLGKGVKEAFIWCLNEVMDNVLTHASPDGGARGYVMATVAGAKRLKVCVFDLGIGLRASFAGTQYATEDDYAAITTAMKAKVTSGIGIDGRVDCIPLSGFGGTTRVDFRMDLGGAVEFDQVFPGSLPVVDLWQEAHEDEAGTVRYGVLEVAGGSGSRPSAAALRTLAENAIENDGKSVTLDFDGVTFCSSAFIDELVGKLIVRYGFLSFTQKVKLVNVRGLSAQLVNHSIAQRLVEGAKGET